MVRGRGMWTGIQVALFSGLPTVRPQNSSEREETSCTDTRTPSQHATSMEMGEVSRSVVSDSLRPHRLYSSWNSPGQNTGVGNLSLVQGIFPTHGVNPGLPHCRQILYQLSHKGSNSYVGLAFILYYNSHTGNPLRDVPPTPPTTQGARL